ncbi:MAG TPA: hypothetical protein VGI82_11795, partial [Chitinophagaceae bacterium]
MKRALLSVAPFCLVLYVRANTYYSTNNAAPNLTSSWHTSRTGSGSPPSNFTVGDIFIIQSGQSLTTTANWTISGTNGKLVIETGATLQANNKITVPSFEIDGSG